VSTLVIEGDLSRAQADPQGRLILAVVRRTLVTGGRNFLRGAGVKGTVTSAVFEVHGIVKITLDQEIVRRINTSGAQLFEEEIRDGLVQLRQTDEDVALRSRVETVDAINAGVRYADEQWRLAIDDGDERALHQAWEMARKVNGLRKRLATMTEGTTP
jgi:hypothetical protein